MATYKFVRKGMGTPTGKTFRFVKTPAKKAEPEKKKEYKRTPFYKDSKRTG